MQDDRNDAPCVTVEDLERRLAAVNREEGSALKQVADLLRELAVSLPPESRLPLRFVATASSIDVMCAIIDDKTAAFGATMFDAKARHWMDD